MIIKIPYHSFIDVITNSSTEIYVSADKQSIEMAKEFIDGLLKIAGSDKTFDDLFEAKVEIGYACDYWDDYKEYILDELNVKWLDDDDNEIKEVVDEYYKKLENSDPEIIEVFSKMVEDDCERFMDSTIVLTTKNDDKETIDLASKFRSIFSIDSQYG